MAKKSKVSLHPSYVVGDISPRLFGAFLEPIGNLVNGSMYRPDHPSADERGFRHDFIDGLKAAGLPAIRYGGNFVSGWRWKESIGPIEKRQTCFDRSRSKIIPKEVGVDEYLAWTELLGADMMFTINLGTDGINEAIDLIDYTNFESGTQWADERIKNGHKEPYNVKIWYLGNEMDGPWQMGSYEKDPHGYGVLARETSKMLKYTDPTVKTIACISSSPFLTHYPSWDQEVLENCYETVDMISLHHYHSAIPGDVGALMAGVQAYEDYINTEIALCDLIKTKLRTDKVMYLSFDEYGSSFRPTQEAHYGLNGNMPIEMFFSFPERPYTYQDPNEFVSFGAGRARVGEMALALANATTVMALIRHADRVKIGCATGGLGMYCATDKDHTWKAASYYTMTSFVKYAKGKSIMPIVDCDKYDVKSYAVDDQNHYKGFKDVPYITAAAALNEEDGEFTVFVSNADWEDDHEFTLDVRAFDGYQFKEHITMYSDDFNAANSYENPDAIKPVVVEDTICKDGVVTAKLNKLSWNVFRFTK